jgi:hypothetical protein
MSTGRSNRPLFDMLDGAKSKPRVTVTRATGSMTTSQVETKPRSLVSSRRGDAMSGAGPRIGLRTRVRLAVRPFLGDSTLTLPANAVYYTAAAVVVAIVIAWIVGFRFGAADKGKELAPFTKPEPLKIQEPGASPAVRPAAVQSQTPQPQAGGVTQTPVTPKGSSVPGAGAAGVEVSATAGPTSANDVILAQGWSAQDPREAGLNYLYLPAVPRDEALRAVKFFAANSLEVMAVPSKVDRRSSSGNNPPPSNALYRLVLRRGITGEQWSAREADRVGMESAVVRLGQIWRRDHKGTTDFRNYSWEKLVESR